MIQIKTKLQFIVAGMLLMTFVACNNEEKKEEATKETTTEVAPAPAPAAPATTDTMEAKPGNVAPGNDVKPQ